MGAFAAGALAEMERHSGNPIVKSFDLIAGTSTGGIIAIGLALGIPAAEIRDFYIKNGRNIFSNIGLVRNLLATLRHIIAPKHSAENLEKLLAEILSKSEGEPLLLGESQTRLVIPAYDGISGRIYVFKTDHHPDFVHDASIPAYKVAVATSSAPTYFRAMRLDEHRTSYVDGGVWANCPALVAVVEAISFLGQEVSSIDVLNVGTTQEPFNVARKFRAGIIGWNKGLINMFMSAQGESSRAMAQLLTQGRFLNVNYKAKNGEFSLDDASRVEDLVGLGRAEAAKRPTANAVAERFLNGKPVRRYDPHARA